ncbi:hypothetical protein [Bacteroides caecimuris]|uniref:hypothetical protein n=1 Tax=Bacteroides caecimuris TaxID=1796613 RepID=UPI002647B8B8|nr:hypothetical protein [Bacteroides caecimuris]
MKMKLSMNPNRQTERIFRYPYISSIESLVSHIVEQYATTIQTKLHSNVAFHPINESRMEPVSIITRLSIINIEIMSFSAF